MHCQESNILTGDPSREPLDRIRNLRHELNAFSQLQRQQIDVLEPINGALFPANAAGKDSKSRKPYDPHPRRAVFQALLQSLRIQNNVIRRLSGMLDDLQHEASTIHDIPHFITLTRLPGPSPTLRRPRLAGQRHRRLYHHNHYLPPPVLRLERFRNEHLGHQRHELQSMGLLGVGDALYFTCDFGHDLLC